MPKQVKTRGPAPQVGARAAEPLPPRTLSSPEEFLRKAMAARTRLTRARYAKLGLATHAPLDPTTHAMLLRQLFLSMFEGRRFKDAHGIAVQAIELDVFTDVLHQDAARAALASGDLESALEHLRTAARRGPASRRPFHLWTLGGTLFLASRYAEAIAALSRATRCSEGEKPLYRAHLALAKIAGGDSVNNLQDTINALAESPAGQGYGRFILGHLAYAAGEWPAARRYLEAFVKRTGEQRASMGIALEGEVRMARATLKKMASNGERRGA